MTVHARDSVVRIGLVYPELLCTYGDRGNAIVLANRLQWRGIEAEVVACSVEQALPEQIDIYCIGGGEDAPQSLATAQLRASQSMLDRARARGAVILAVCAGFQIVGHHYRDAYGNVSDGIGLLDFTTEAGSPRLIGECIVRANPALGLVGDDAIITGFENHGGRTTLGADVEPFGVIEAGNGNGVADSTGALVDGAIEDRFVGTYLHGPVLARNAALADLLLSWVVGDLEPLPSIFEARLHAERVDQTRKRGWSAWLRDRHLARS